MAEAGDAALAITDAYRINYDTLGDAGPALHSHIIPRYRHEPEEKRRRSAWVGYDWPTPRRFDGTADRAFMAAMRARLTNQRAQGA